jgi:hypothetical protein
MPKKSRKKPETYAGWTEEEWRNWGENFGKFMGQRGKEFGEEIKSMAQDRKKEWKKARADWWFGTFGLVGPLIGSIIGIVFLGIGIWLLNFINLVLGSSLIGAVSNFLFLNLEWFFLIFIFSGYNDYFSKKFPESYWIVSPIMTSASIVIALWIFIWVLNIVNTVPKNTVIAAISTFLSTNLQALFVLFLVIGYVAVAVKKLVMNAMEG